MPKISVIIPSYNHAPFIADAINSVINQTFQNFELLIIDDSSNDDSVNVISKFIDERISFIVNKENMGACITMNKLIELATGEYIALLNSDDVWEPEKLAKQVEFMVKNKQYGAVFSNARIINQDGSPFQNQEHFYATVFEQPNRSRFEWLNYFFNVGNALCHPSVLIRKSVYDDIGLYNPLMASLPDFEMWVRVCLKYDIFIMPERLVKFRILDNEQNASGMNPENIVACQFEYKHILDHFLKLSLTEYEKVFNEPAINTIEFSLALKALEKQSQFLKTWGLDTLYTTLEKNPQYLTPKEFTTLTRKNDIFNVINRVDYFIQLFLDLGVGISEENSIKLPIIQNNEAQHLIFDLTGYESLNNLRFNPLNEACVIEIEELKILYPDNIDLDLITRISANACIHHGKSYFFETINPVITFEGLSGEQLVGAEKLIVKIRYPHIAKDALEVSIKQIKLELDQTKVELAQTKVKLDDSNTELDQTKTELEQTKRSLTWQVTQPLQKIKQILKGD